MILAACSQYKLSILAAIVLITEYVIRHRKHIVDIDVLIIRHFGIKTRRYFCCNTSLRQILYRTDLLAVTAGI